MNQVSGRRVGGCCWVTIVVCWICICGAVGAAETAKPAANGATANIIIVTLDGMRWQEVFGGFDPMLATEASGGVRNPVPPAQRLRRDSPPRKAGRRSCRSSGTSSRKRAGLRRSRRQKRRPRHQPV